MREPGGPGRADLIKLIDARTAKSFDAIEKAINQVSRFYTELSIQNLNPGALYTITGPYHERSVVAFALRPVLIAFGVVMMSALLLISAAVLTHDLLRKETA